MENQKETTLRTFIAMFCADIDLFLLQDEAQENDLDKLYTKEEIREQLYKSMTKFTSLPIVNPMLYDMPLFPSLTDSYLLQMGFSKKELKSIKNTQ